MSKKEKHEELELRRGDADAFNPFVMMRRFTKDLERLFEDFEGRRFPQGFKEFWLRPESQNVDWMPQLEIHQNNGQLVVKADLPGLKRDDVKIEIANMSVKLSGERKEETEEKGKGFYRSERTYGRFFRQVPLPEGAQTENATATFHEGVLEITVPVPAEVKARKLEINDKPAAKEHKAAAA